MIRTRIKKIQLPFEFAGIGMFWLELNYDVSLTSRIYLKFHGYHSEKIGPMCHLQCDLQWYVTSITQWNGLVFTASYLCSKVYLLEQQMNT